MVRTDGDKAQRQAKPGNRYEMWNMYIAGEVGGMAESLARLSEMVDSKDEKEKLLEAPTASILQLCSTLWRQISMI